MYALPIISTYEVLNLIFQVNIDSETHVHLPTMIKKQQVPRMLKANCSE